MWVTCLRLASSGYHAEFHEGCYPKHTNPLNCRTSSSAISCCHAGVHEGYGTVGEWHERGMAWQGNGIGAAWARHGMCELSLIDTIRPLVTSTGRYVNMWGYRFLTSTYE
jgi:hypothetical protein